jgi:hypothetical protein
MPAKSEAQQRFFGMVHSYQQGKLSSDKASAAVKRVAKTISSDDAKKYASTSHDDLQEILASIVSSPLYTEQLIREAIYSSTPVKVKGKYIDNYTAKLISLTLENLTENNKLSLLENNIDQIVALSYKIITH